MPAQIALQLLRYCALPRLSFLARTIHPTHFQSAADSFDAQIIACFHAIIRISGMSRPPDTSVDELHTQITLPLKAGGIGLRPVKRVSHAAYFASCASIMPDFIAAFPSSHCADYTATELHAELEHCRAHLHKHGVGVDRPVRTPHKLKRGHSHMYTPVMPSNIRPKPGATAGTDQPLPSAGTFRGSVADLWKRA